MSSRTTARHRKATRALTPLDDFAPTARRGLAVAASSGLALTMMASGANAAGHTEVTSSGTIEASGVTPGVGIFAANAREALAARAEREGEPGTRVLVALTGEGRRAARAGSTILVEDVEAGTRELGAVTSGLLSPTLGHPVALALLAPYSGDEPTWPVGTVLAADVRGKRLPMTVVATPFYKRAR